MLFSNAYQQRFGGVLRLYGTRALARIYHSHALIIGIGGVGSWTAEALVRSGIGAITLMDMDDICISNTNRQLHTTSNTIGTPKTHTMAARLLAINPELKLKHIDDFISKDTIATVIDPGFSIVIDAIDNAIDKAEVIAFCKHRDIPIISIGSSGGKKDPRAITAGDLKKTTGDALFTKTRNNLRRRHGFSRDTQKDFGVEVIYSTEALTYPDQQGETSTTKITQSPGQGLDCSGGYGASTMVTASFGLLAAARAVEVLAMDET